MKAKRNENLVIEGNAFYEVDRECMNKGLNKIEQKEKAKEKNRNMKKNDSNFLKNDI